MRGELSYYTLEYDETPNGRHDRLLFIGEATDEKVVRLSIEELVGTELSEDSYSVRKGANVSKDFVDMLTENAKKVILKIAAKNEDAPKGFIYVNMSSIDIDDSNPEE